MPIKCSNQLSRQKYISHLTLKCSHKQNELHNKLYPPLRKITGGKKVTNHLSQRPTPTVPDSKTKYKESNQWEMIKYNFLNYLVGN